LAEEFSRVQVSWKRAELVMSLRVNAKGDSDRSKTHLVSLIRNGRFEGRRLTVYHAGSAEVGKLPTATDLVSLITVQR